MKWGNKLETYSFSRLRRFSECPLSYYKKYIEGDDTENGHGTSEFGSFVHLILEKYAKKEIDLSDIVSYYVENFNINVNSTFILKMSDTFKKNFEEDYYMSGLDYLTNFEGFSEFGEILEVEYEFEIEYNNKFKINGKIDLVTKDKDGNIYIIDHKSKSAFKNKKEMAEYRRQLYIYSFAIKNKYGKFPKKLYFNMFRKNKILEFDFSEQDYYEALNWFENTVDEIENNIVFLSNIDSFFCRNFCDYRDNCEERWDYYEQ